MQNSPKPRYHLEAQVLATKDHYYTFVNDNPSVAHPGVTFQTNTTTRVIQGGPKKSILKIFCFKCV